jgi:hypothetical protein
MKKYISSAAILLVLSCAAWAAPRKHEANEQAALQKEAKITMAQAKKAALAKEPGTINSQELERENQKLIYSFDIQTKSGIHEVNVDAISGDVVEDKAESAAAEAKEKDKDKKHSHAATSTPANDKNDK